MFFNLLAQVVRHDLGGTLKGQGPLGNPGTSGAQVADSFENLVSKVIGVLTVSAILWFLLMFILGAIGWINAGGDSKAVEAARSKILNAVIGLVIVFVALIFASAIGALLGVDVLNVGQSIINLGK